MDLFMEDYLTCTILCVVLQLHCIVVLISVCEELDLLIHQHMVKKIGLLCIASPSITAVA